MTNSITPNSLTTKFSNSTRSWNGLRQVRLTAEKARRRLHEFVRQAWPVLEPETPFVDGLYVHAVCGHLQAVAGGRIQNLIMNIPPGHAKSLLTAVFWPAWVWIDHPEVRWLFSSYREPLATRDSVKCRRLIESDWYQARWGDRFQLTSDQNQKHRFENTRTGYRVVVPMSAGTGGRGDYVVVDDPHWVDQADSDKARQSAVEWWNGAMATRLNNLSTGHQIVIMQRLHESDLTGDLLGKGGYDILCLPAEFEPDRRCAASIGWRDPREECGEQLWPEKVNRAALESLMVTLGSYRYAAQYQKRPAPAEGGLFKRVWWRYWGAAHLRLPPVPVCMPDGETRKIHAIPLPQQFDQVLQSWDLAFKDLATSDYVVGQVWGAVSADRYLLDQRRDRLDMPRTVEAIRSMSDKWPQAAAKPVEDRANGPAVIASLRHEISGLIAINPGKTRQRRRPDRSRKRVPPASGCGALGGGSHGGVCRFPVRGSRRPSGRFDAGVEPVVSTEQLDLYHAGIRLFYRTAPTHRQSWVQENVGRPRWMDGLGALCV